MGKRAGRRQCPGCGARLAADNPADRCSPCLRRGATGVNPVPVHPAGFWRLPELADALAAQDFGHVLRAYRLAHSPPIKQSQLGLWFGITQGQISRIERGDAFDYSIEKLRRWAGVIGIPQQLLWFHAEPHSPDSYDDAADSSSVQDTGGATGESVQRRQFLKATSGSALGVGASLLGATAVADGQDPARRRSVGSPEVDLLREMTGAFRRVDNRYGGGHSRTAVGTYLKTMVEPMLTEGRSRAAVRDDLFDAAAELHQLAGWMAYDTGQAQAGRGHLRTALRLCQESNNPALSAEMLAGMSHQAAFHNVPEAAVDLALAARQTARQAGVPLLQAEAAVMEAHGLALQGDKQGCLAALRDAENTFAAASGREAPEWLTYFDNAYLSAKFAHTFRDLGQPREAEGFARRSLEMSEGYERGRLFNTALLASIVADLGQLDEACSLGATATQMASEVRSVRSMAYLADLARRLARYEDTREVSELYVRMVDAGIPVPTSS